MPEYHCYQRIKLFWRPQTTSSPDRKYSLTMDFSTGTSSSKKLLNRTKWYDWFIILIMCIFVVIQANFIRQKWNIKLNDCYINRGTFRKSLGLVSSLIWSKYFLSQDTENLPCHLLENKLDPIVEELFFRCKGLLDFVAFKTHSYALHSFNHRLCLKPYLDFKVLNFNEIDVIRNKVLLVIVGDLSFAGYHTIWLVWGSRHSKFGFGEQELIEFSI